MYESMYFLLNMGIFQPAMIYSLPEGIYMLNFGGVYTIFKSPKTSILSARSGNCNAGVAASGCFPANLA